jgi:hypothetical protein
VFSNLSLREAASRRDEAIELDRRGVPQARDLAMSLGAFIPSITQASLGSSSRDDKPGLKTHPGFSSGQEEHGRNRSTSRNAQHFVAHAHVPRFAGRNKRTSLHADPYADFMEE